MIIAFQKARIVLQLKTNWVVLGYPFTFENTFLSHYKFAKDVHKLNKLKARVKTYNCPKYWE